MAAAQAATDTTRMATAAQAAAATVAAAAAEGHGRAGQRHAGAEREGRAGLENVSHENLRERMPSCETNQRAVRKFISRSRPNDRAEAGSAATAREAARPGQAAPWRAPPGAMA